MKSLTPIQHAVRIKHVLRRKRKRPRRMQPPMGLERQYQRRLLELVRIFQKIIRETVLPRLSEIVSLGDQHKVRRDDYQTAADLIAEVMAKTQLAIDEVTQSRTVKLLADTIAYQISDYNKAQINKVFTDALGVDLITSEPYLNGAISAFVAENVDLITDVGRKVKGDLAQRIYQGVRSGLRSEEIAKNITSTLPVAPDGSSGVFRSVETRAKLIGRDQVNKFNGELTKLRQKDVGVKSYIWRTALDERVRETHAANEGEEFEWDDPTPGEAEGQPGEEINCRCYAEPVMEGLLE